MSLKQENYKSLQSKSIYSPLGLVDNFQIGIVHTKWNEKYVSALVNGCVNKLNENGVSNNNILFNVVPGSFDTIYGVKSFILKQKLDAIIVIGIILKGDTSHYDFLMNSIAYGFQKLQSTYDIPIVNGILTCENEEQIIERTIKNNHGFFWANNVIDLIHCKFNLSFTGELKHIIIDSKISNYLIHTESTHVPFGKFKCSVNEIELLLDISDKNIKVIDSNTLDSKDNLQLPLKVMVHIIQQIEDFHK